MLVPLLSKIVNRESNRIERKIVTLSSTSLGLIPWPSCEPERFWSGRDCSCRLWLLRRAKKDATLHEYPIHPDGNHARLPLQAPPARVTAGVAQALPVTRDPSFTLHTPYRYVPDLQGVSSVSRINLGPFSCRQSSSRHNVRPTSILRGCLCYGKAASTGDLQDNLYYIRSPHQPSV